MSGWPDMACGGDGWLTETGSDIQHPLAGVNVGQLDQPYIDVLGGLFKTAL
jgi:hypothetical protein